MLLQSKIESSFCSLKRMFPLYIVDFFNKFEKWFYLIELATPNRSKLYLFENMRPGNLKRQKKFKFFHVFPIWNLISTVKQKSNPYSAIHEWKMN